MKIEASAEVGQAAFPEGMAGLTQPGRQLALKQLLHVGVAPLAKQGPHILKV